MTTITPRVLVSIKATGTCYLPHDPPFNLILQWQLCNSEEEPFFLEDGFAGDGNYQPINSNQVIQCFDDETGEQVQVVHQGTRPVFFERGAIHFTSSDTRQPDELPFLTSSLRAGRRYRLRFKPTTLISHWPASAENALDSLQDAPSGSASTSDVPTPSTYAIPWEATDGKDTVVFETRSSRPSTPSVTASLSTPSTYSLSKPFTFALTFSTDATQPITVLAVRERPISEYTDVKILDATSCRQLFPNLIICRDDGEPEREDFLRLEGAYTEHREVHPESSFWSDIKLEIGKEYILSHQGGTWVWTEDTIDEVMDYLNSESSAGLAPGGDIEFAGADEARFKVVE
jgi:hypothetical protein